MYPYRRCCLLLLVGVLAASADPGPDVEGLYGYGYSERQGRRQEGETALLNPRYEPQQSRLGDSNVRDGYSQQEEPEEDNHSSGSANIQQYSPHQRAMEDPPEDSATDADSSYSTMVVHNRQERPKSSPNVRYQTIRKKPLKNYPKVRQSGRKTPSNHKTHKNIKQADPPPHHPQQQHSASQSIPGDSLVQAVHPSIMQNLLNQQPQTFDVPQQKEGEELTKVYPEWSGHADDSKINTDYSFNPFTTRTDLQKGEESSEVDHNVGQRPIYVPNRVSVQNPSSDSLFNVGYSIGFGNGIFQRPKPGLVDPPVGVRQGKEISHPTTFQNTPVHVDGMNSVWKNMGSGVEISHNVNQNIKTFEPYRGVAISDHNEHTSGSLLHHPIFAKEELDQSFNSVSTIGRNSFDHNHALQQSNTFDFSNAINPATNQPFSSPDGLVKSFRQPHPSYEDSFLKKYIPSSIESNQPPLSYTEPHLKQTYPTYVDQRPKQETTNSSPNQFNKPVSGDKYKYDDIKYNTPKYERPSFSGDTQSSFRAPSSVGFSPKPKAIDFSKVHPTNFKSSYSAQKPFLNGDVHFNNQDPFGNNFGFQGLPQVYSPPIKPQPGGMVQAILVPVNTPAPAFPYPVHIPHGYPPYLGHPVGMISIPESPQEERPTVKGGYEPSDAEYASPPETQQYTPVYKKSPSRQVHHFNSAVNHQIEKPSESSQFTHFPRASHSIHRSEDSDELQRPVNYKRVFTTETPERATSEVKSHSSSVYSHPSDYASASSAHYPVNSHHQRIYRRPVIIVKRA